MSGDLDLDAILAEYYAGEEQPKPEPEAAPAASRRSRREAMEPAPEAEAPAAAGEPKPEQTAPAPVKELPRQGRKTAARRRRGRIHMGITLLVLVALLTGLLLWAIRDEQREPVEEPVPIRMELGEALEGYLDEASTHSHG